MRVANIVLVHVAVAAIEIRVIAVVVGLVRTLRRRREFVTARFGLAELVNTPESLLLAGLGYVAHLHALRTVATPPRVVAAGVGAVCAIACLVLMFWTLASWRGLFTGHAVTEGQRVITHGAFGFVRHPVYLGVFLSWLGGALAFGSWLMAAVLVLYVIPSYVLYARSEERMMLSVFGDDYDAYRRSTPMLVPSIDKLAPLTRSA